MKPTQPADLIFLTLTLQMATIAISITVGASLLVVCSIPGCVHVIPSNTLAARDFRSYKLAFSYEKSEIVDLIINMVFLKIHILIILAPLLPHNFEII